MGFRLGNFNIDEIINCVAESFDGDLLYSLDQLNSASIEITSESTDITDKNGNIVRTIYKSKQGTFSATSAFMTPAILNNASGSSIVDASASAPIIMPKITLLQAGATNVKLDATIDAATLQVIAIFGGGANGAVLKSGASAVYDEVAGTYTYKYDESAKEITLPASGADKPTQYLVKYDRNVTSGIKMENTANAFPDTVKLTLYCSYVDPCDDQLRA